MTSSEDCNQAMTNEDVTVIALAFSRMLFRKCKLEAAMWWFVVTHSECSTNPITNPNPVSTH